MTVHVFVGPTLPAARARDARPDATIHGPVIHGDLLRLDPAPGDVVAIIDGQYHQYPPVRHKEILHLIANGVRVIGAASMGALRAAELHPFGMIGHGTVFEMYRDGVIDDDAEVSLSHGPAPDYVQFSEPLVAVRHAVRQATRAGVVGAEDAERIVEAAQAMPYTERTWRAVEAAVGPLDALRRFLADHPEHANVKAHDAFEMLQRVDELAARGAAAPSDWMRADGWRNRYLYEWLTRFSPGDGTSDEEVLRYQQIYHEDFPRRWRQFVIDRICAHDGGSGEQALAVAAGWGITMTPDLADHWLTTEEASAPSALLTVLVRSYLQPYVTHQLAAAVPDLVADPAARRAVAEAAVANARVAEVRPGYLTGLIRPAALVEYLRIAWRMPDADEHRLRLAGLDRGFPTLADATDATRLFLLRHRLIQASS